MAGQISPATKRKSVQKKKFHFYKLKPKSILGKILVLVQVFPTLFLSSMAVSKFCVGRELEHQAGG